MRILLKLICICIIHITYAQTKENTIENTGFIGEDVLFNTLGSAHGILAVDSCQTIFNVEGLNYFGLENLNEYRIGISHINTGIGYKFSYRYVQENIFENHEIYVGIQKQLSTKLLANVMLGTEMITHLERIQTGITYGISLRYQVNKQLEIQQNLKNIYKENIHRIEIYQCALYYNLSNQFSALAQLDYQQVFDGRIGLLFHYKSMTVQVSQRFVQNRLEIGLGYQNSKFNMGLLYSYHEILGGVSYASFQFRL